MSREEKQFFSTREIATYLSVSTDAVLKWIKQDKLPGTYSTPGGQKCVPAATLRELFEKNEIPIDESFFAGRVQCPDVLIVSSNEKILDEVSFVVGGMRQPGIKIHEAGGDYTSAGIRAGSINPRIVVIEVEKENLDRAILFCYELKKYLN